MHDINKKLQKKLQLANSDYYDYKRYEHLHQTENALRGIRRDIVASLLSKNKKQKKRPLIRRVDKRLANIDICRLKFSDIGNYEFIALYIAKFGTCRYKEVHDALTTWRLMPSSHYIEYFTHRWVGRYWDKEPMLIEPELRPSPYGGYEAIVNRNRRREYFLTRKGRALVSSVLKRIEEKEHV